MLSTLIFVAQIKNFCVDVRTLANVMSSERIFSVMNPSTTERKTCQYSGQAKNFNCCGQGSNLRGYSIC